ncbi:MFS transporter [Prevotella sp. E9-3]|uniref:MFS transporter n=1 Tax=Prevotella sp. E9-3 TaxID=2913621 RepID=UPI001EDA4AD3|nr:MFS transporter [Prevotella sp. E9-3]UKK47010.1 MFS transporter [Prevotella sp. E9-3]
MNTQNTTVHLRLWHRNFWVIVIANLLLCMSVTMLIPTLPLWMLYKEGLTIAETGIAMGIFGIGVFLPGFVCSYLVQHYRRNLVCVWAILLLASTILFPLYVGQTSPVFFYSIRMAQGVAFGLAQMVLASTLIIDTCDSSQRTEANHSTSWFGRFALSLGPLVGLLIYEVVNMEMVLFVASGCCIVASCLILAVHFPFRVPSDHLNKFSLDRFLLVKGWPLLVNMLPVMIAVGIVFSLPHTIYFYALMMVGFLLALLAQRYVFADADLKSEIISGLVLLISAILTMLFSPSSPLCAPLMALGLGIVGARFLLFFIKLSKHCQRGTAQSTFLLGWELGLSLGVGAGYLYFEGDKYSSLECSLGLLVVSLVLYVLFIHKWFITNKNR